MTFDYTSGNPNNLVGNQPASMADIQGSFTDIRAFLNTRISGIPTLVSALPVSPVDGQEIHYLADATNGIVWPFRYRAASGSTYKWESMGAQVPLFSSADAEQTTASTTYVGLAGDPSLSTPLAGDYDVEWGARIYNNTVNAASLMTILVGAVTPVDTEAIDEGSSTANIGGTGNMRRRKTGLAAATTITPRYRVTGGTGAYSRRWLQISPVRVG